MSEETIIPSSLKYKSAPSVDQRTIVSLQTKQELNLEFNRINTISLPQTYIDERQTSTVFRPTFQINYVYSNPYIGTTNYAPFLNNLYYVGAETSYFGGTWSGYPQFFEFDFLRTDINDQHITYVSKSAYTYNWTYYLSYAYENDSNKTLTSTLNNSTFIWTASDGIPFTIKNITIDGNGLISFECICPHGLTVGESVELSLNYNNNNIFEIYSLGNGIFQSEINVFNVFDIGFTGGTFANGVTGTFKRVINPTLLAETKSKYYLRKHKILTNVDELIINPTGFQKNPFREDKKIFLSSITPDNKTRIAKRQSSASYTITSRKDIDLKGLLDNQKRPVSELFLTIINKGYSGYFNKPFATSGLKQGWFFNITSKNNAWWADGNTNADTSIKALSYTKSSNNSQYTFYYNEDLKSGDVIYGDFCEWNDYEQSERVVSSYYHKLKYNQTIFQTTTQNQTNADGFYYEPHHKMQIRVYSDYIETGSLDNIDGIPSYSFFATSDQEFRWRDIYDYGFIDELGRGVDYPYVNNSHYPFTLVNFKLFPEGNNVNESITGVDEPVKPLIDGCE